VHEPRGAKMQPTKVCCNGTTVQFTCYSPESPDIFWKICIERCLTKWKQLCPDGNFYSSYLKGTLIFFLIQSDEGIQMHHWLEADEHLVPKDIIRKADDIRKQPEIDKGLFAAEIQPWGKAN
jgi:hypothetical protein